MNYCFASWRHFFLFNIVICSSNYHPQARERERERDYFHGRGVFDHGLFSCLPGIAKVDAKFTYQEKRKIRLRMSRHITYSAQFPSSIFSQVLT